jgi:hypothetical protein
MPPLILWAAGALGALAVGKWLARESGRINSELDVAKSGATGDRPSERPNLKRDPNTGVYRPQ